MNKRTWLFQFAALPLAALALHADVQLPALISDHMLLQRDVPVRIWGKADPGEQVSVKFRSQAVAVKADTLGRWAAILQPSAAGGPFTLSIQGKNAIEVKDVLVGEVWVASGQSNMAFTVSRGDNAEKELVAANYPQIRLFKVATKVSEVPLDDVTAKWAACDPKSAASFSAAGYFFARHLHQKLNVPIGVIESDWGGTPAQAWTSGPALAADPALISVFADWAKSLNDNPEAMLRYQAQIKNWDATVAKAKADGKPAPRKPNPPAGPNHQWAPSGLYNAMIAPLTPYAIKGAIWYQGESNAGQRRAYVYRRLFQAMIQDWRNAWGQGDFPFLFVQLANFGKNDTESQWPELREAQTMALQLKNTGMAVTIDIGNPNDIHPTNKQDVGLRLGLAARAVAYGEKLVYSGPLFRQVTVEDNALRVWFDHTTGGLTAKGGALKGFLIAGKDGNFVPAEARIDKETVVVSSPKVKQPLHVRYAWAESPECNLFNASGLPAGPFRSDEWQEPKVYR